MQKAVAKQVSLVVIFTEILGALGDMADTPKTFA
jgi:hypothetical protein